MSELGRVLAHPDVRRLAVALAEHPGARIDSPGESCRAAVAVILRVQEGSIGREAGGDPMADEGIDVLELLLIKRADYEGDPWSGHVALPGGRREESDSSLEATAVRETREETAIDLATTGFLLGTLDELQPRTPALPPIIITPFVFVTRSDIRLLPSHEVADAFWVSVSELQDPGAAREIELELSGGKRLVKSFGFRSHEIWGLTERILSQLLRQLEHRN